MSFIVGHCVWLPPSAKAALVFTMLFYGIGNTGDSAFVENAEKAIAAQYVAAGQTPVQATANVAWLNRCIETWRPP